MLQARLAKGALFAGLLLLPLAALGPAGCGGVPRNAARTRYSKQLEHAQPYYKTLRTGIFSRTVTLQPESYAWQLLQSVAKHWDALDDLASAEKLAAFLDAQKLQPLALRVRQALKAGLRERPKNADPALEAGAIKQGLLEAYKRLEREGD